jgi:hypothetical protein
MALVNLSLLAFGSLLVVVPIVLHLVMRQQPKQLVFPAVRFVRQRREANRRRMQLRHWLLLLLRCAAICVLAAALARPSVASAAIGNWVVIAGVAAMVLVASVATVLARIGKKGRTLVGGLGAASVLGAVMLGWLVVRAVRGSPSGLLGAEQAPVAAVLVFDTAPRMEYVHRNRTRLAEAKENARWLLRQLPDESQVAIMDLRGGPAAFAIDRGAAARAVGGLEITYVSTPLALAVDRGIKLAKESEKVRKEIYIFTDLSAAAWSMSATSQLRSQLDEASDTAVYLWDVGVEGPRNFTLSPLRLSSGTVANHSALDIQTELVHTGPGGERTIQLFLEQPDEALPVIVDGRPVLPQAHLRSSETISVQSGGGVPVSFPLRGLAVGTHHGYLKISGQDGLACDDVRYFSLQVTGPWPILVVAGAGARAEFVTAALAPEGFRDTGRARFHASVVEAQELATLDLGTYAAVSLLDPEPQPEWIWQKLAEYVRAGGGVAIFLGRNAKKEPFNELDAQALLPGKLVRHWRAANDSLFLAPRALDHPVLARFRSIATAVPWNGSPVFVHWMFEELDPDSRVVLRYGNNQPAIVESTIGQGRVLTMTTPLSDPLYVVGRQAWNELLTSLDSWPTLILCNEMLSYLVQGQDVKLNFLVGEPARLRAASAPDAARAQLFTPRGDWRELSAEGGELVYRFTEVPGTYRLKGGPASAVAAGFSVNLPAEASQLDRLPGEKLDEIFGPNRYHLARTHHQIDRGVDEARIGREFYSFLLVLLVIILGLEHTLANWFYREQSAAPRGAANLWQAIGAQKV